MEPQKSVGIWLRVSTEDQAKGESPEHHEKRARLYAEAKGWDVEVVYHLEAVSGKSVVQHPETQKMLRDIKNGTISGLIFSKLARLSRNKRELEDFADIFRTHNADLISLQESIDTSTPAGRMFYTMLAALANWEREEIASRVAASIPIRAKLGKNLGGTAPFGYKWENKQFVVDETEAPVRKLIYELFREYKRRRTVARELNDRGYRTRGGSAFSDTSILRLLRDPSAKGEHRINAWHGDKSLGMKPKEEWVTHPCEPIIPTDLWNECNRILDEQQSKAKRLGPRAVHLLSGYVRCTCGQKMYVFHQNNVYTCPKCRTRIPADDLDDIYHGQLKEYLLTETHISDYMKSIDESLKEKEQLLQTVTDTLATLKTKMDGLVDLRIAKEMDAEMFKERYKPLEEQYLQMGNQLPELQADVDFTKIQYMSSDTVLAEARNLYDRWLTIPFEEKRSIVETITEHITVGKEDIFISLAYLPATFQNAVKVQPAF